MKDCKYKFKWEHCLFVLAIILFSLALGFGIKEILRNRDSSHDSSQGFTTEDEKLAIGEIPSEEVRLNTFLTFVVQQNIENFKNDLDEDAELIRFVFGYRKANAPDTISEQESNGVLCRTLTLKQVNETLSYFFGITIFPIQSDYSIIVGDSDSFYCKYHNGYFWNIPPYPKEKFDFPIRFALAEKIDYETSTVNFRLYQLNPDGWQVGEAERHVVLTPMMSIYGIENGNNETKKWFKWLGNGKATFRDLGENLRLLDLEITTKH